MKKIIIAILLMLMLTGCVTRTVYVESEIPNFNPTIPERPVLDEIKGEVSSEVAMIIVKLMGYAKELEAYGEAWREYYSILKRNE